MQTFKIALTIVVALFVQVLLPQYLSFFRYVDLPLIVTVYVALQRAPFLGMVTGCVAGIGSDSLVGGIIGVGGFSRTLIGYIVAMVSIKLSVENPLTRLAVVGVASVVNTVLFVGLHQMLRQEHVLEQVLPYVGSWGEFGATVGWRALGDSLTAAGVFIALDRVFAEQRAARRMAIKRRFYE
ncbi:MAG: rod shape-determining protein MreD [Acidobacteriota bacterium]